MAPSTSNCRKPLVTLTGDPAQPLLARGGLPLRGQTKPGGKVAPRLELSGINRRRQRQRTDRANPRHLRELLAQRIALVQLGQLSIEFG